MTSPEPAAAPEHRRNRRWARIGIGLTCLVVVAAAIVAAGRRGDDPLAEAIAIAASEDGYDTGLEAGRTLARTASALNRAIRTCDRVEEPQRCSALGAASGYVQVVAATVVRCTAPGREEARRSVVGMLEDVRAVERGDPAPPVPPIPRCRG